MCVKRLTLDELRDVFPDEGDTLTMRVRADAPNLALQLLCAGNDIVWPFAPHEVDQGRVLHEGGNLLGMVRAQHPSRAEQDVVTE